MGNDGILLLDKPAGLTSRAVDNAVQRLFSTRHVGHLGTLDPFATGLLIVSVGKAGKFLPYMEDGWKTYEATLELGISTSTGDPEGEILEEKEIPSLNKEDIEKALASFLGVSTQIPPMTSAIKVGGKALYELAHQGMAVERKPRQIEVRKAELLAYDGKRISFRVEVSKGTYIRVLGEDIAKKLGTVGHLVALRRTAIGPFSIEEALPLEKVTTEALQNPLRFVTAYPKLEIASGNLAKAKNGMTMDFELTAPEVLLTHEGQAIALYEKRLDGHYHCKRGLF